MYCTHCGTKIPEGNSFCSNCGNRIVNESKPENISSQKIPQLTLQKTSKGNSIFFIVIVVAVVIGGIYFFYQNLPQNKKNEIDNSIQGITNELSNTTKISAAELYSRYQNDKQEANRLYEYKEIIISCFVRESFSIHDLGDYDYAYGYFDHKDFMVFDNDCSFFLFFSREIDAIHFKENSKKIGNEILIKGECYGLGKVIGFSNEELVIKNCQILN